MDYTKYLHPLIFIENLHQQRELWIRVVSGNQRLILPSEIEINPGWRPSSVLLMWSLDIEWENLPIPWNIFSKGPPNVFKSFLKTAIVREKKFGSVGTFSKCLPPFVYQILCLHILVNQILFCEAQIAITNFRCVASSICHQTPSLCEVDVSILQRPFMTR